MDKTHPSISVFTSMPNNGYYALVFTDSGVAMSANCKKQDAYEGLLEACAQFLLDCVNDEIPDFNPPNSRELTPDEEAQVDRYAELIVKAHNAFYEALRSKLIIGVTTKQFELRGIPHGLARALAAGIEAFPEKFEKAFGNDDCDEEDYNDSDDEYNLD